MQKRTKVSRASSIQLILVAQMGVLIALVGCEAEQLSPEEASDSHELEGKQQSASADLGALVNLEYADYEQLLSPTHQNKELRKCTEEVIFRGGAYRENNNVFGDAKIKANFYFKIKDNYTPILGVVYLGYLRHDTIGANAGANVPFNFLSELNIRWLASLVPSQYRQAVEDAAIAFSRIEIPSRPFALATPATVGPGSDGGFDYDMLQEYEILTSESNLSAESGNDKATKVGVAFAIALKEGLCVGTSEVDYIDMRTRL